MAPTPAVTAPANINHVWAGLLVEELVRQGVGLFVVCPGSRSSPLAVAVAGARDAEAVVHWDERAAAFVALGWGRATGRPAAVVTTSGTAVANLLPAAVEADADGVPLLLLTADRPPELRETGANQTVRQPPVFQDVARWTLDAPVPTSAVPARWVLSTAAHAVRRALAPPGPVHLNLPFREPLGAQPDGTDVALYLAGLPTHRSAPPTLAVPMEGGLLEGAASALLERERGLVVLADAGRGRLGDAADRLAAALGWPLLTDVRASSSPSAVGAYDLALASARMREALRPDAVLHVGGRLTSKRLGQLFAAARPPLYVQVSETPGRVDPDGLVTERLVGPLDAALAGITDHVEAARSGGETRGEGWRDAWRRASRAASETLGLAELSEPSVARAVCEASASALVVAASMPIRDALTYGGGRAEVVANRGASGIDGTVATAHGVARGRGGPVVLLAGDLALLHDQTSLALLRSGPPVVVVAVNNDGGGIFHRLPIADGVGALDADTFERFFGTPHGLGFEDAARQVGLAYYAPVTQAAFETALDAALRSGASALVEVRTDRGEQAALRRRLEAAAAEAVDAALGGLDAR